MAITLERVNSGDLITAEFINGIVAAIEALDMKVAALEAVTILDTNIHITAIFPDPIRVGQTLTIVGKNFDYTIGANRIYIEGTRIVSYLAGSSDNQLIFKVPAIPGLPTSGRQVTLTVSNKSSSVSKTITVLPIQQILSGYVTVQYESTDPTTITRGNPVTFHYKLLSRATLPADFLITPIISETSWQPNLRIRDAYSAEIPTGVIHLDAWEEAEFEVYLTEVPADTAVTDFTLEVNASAGNVKGSDLRNFTVGSVAPQPDPNINFNAVSITPTSAISNNTIQLAEGDEASLNMDVQFLVEGIYDITIYFYPPTTGWTVDTRPGTFLNFEISDAPDNKILRFTISPGQDPSPTGKVELKLQRDGETRSRSLIYNLMLI